MLLMCLRFWCTHMFSCRAYVLEAGLLSRLVAVLSFLRVLLCTCLCVCVSVCLRACTRHGVCGEGTTCRSRFFPSILVLGAELRSPSLIINAFTWPASHLFSDAATLFPSLSVIHRVSVSLHCCQVCYCLSFKIKAVIVDVKCLMALWKNEIVSALVFHQQKL